MDDLFGMLYSDLDPSKKLLTAITHNKVDTLDHLISSGVDLDAALFHHNGNRAVHIACQNGHSACLRKLLEKGANADCPNSFGHTALAVALRHSFPDCVRILMTHGTKLTDPLIIWNSQFQDESNTWLSYNVDCLKVLINATPDLSWFDLKLLDKLCSKGSDLIRYFLVCGNRIEHGKAERVVAKTNEENVKWYKEFKKCNSLQHYARTEIRKHLRPNVYYGSKNLPIPLKIQEYLLITNTDYPCV